MEKRSERSWIVAVACAMAVGLLSLGCGASDDETANEEEEDETTNAAFTSDRARPTPGIRQRYGPIVDSVPDPKGDDVPQFDQTQPPEPNDEFFMPVD